MNGLYCLGLLSLLSIFVIAGHLIYLWLVSWSVSPSTEAAPRAAHHSNRNRRCIPPPGACTIWLGEISWDGVDPGGGTKGLFPTSTPPSPLPSRCKSDSAAFAQPSVWLLFAFGVAACVVFRAFGLSSAAVCVCCWLWLAVVVGVCLLALWGFCSPGVSFVFLFAGSASSVLLLFLLAAAVVFCPLMLVAAVGVPVLVPCGFCPPWGVFLLVVVSGVCCLVLWASWGFCSPWGVRLLLWVAVVCGRCLSFDALGLCPRCGV